MATILGIMALLTVLALGYGVYEWVMENIVLCSVVIIAIIIIWAILKDKKERNKNKSVAPLFWKKTSWTVTMADVDNMDGVTFETFVERVLIEKGYTSIVRTPYSGDHGVDILATMGINRYAVQCKRYSRSVGNKAIQEAFTGQHYYKADCAIVVTNSRFTSSAKEEAKRLRVELWDRSVLEKIVRSGIELEY